MWPRMVLSLLLALLAPGCGTGSADGGKTPADAVNGFYKAMCAKKDNAADRYITGQGIYGDEAPAGLMMVAGNRDAFVTKVSVVAVHERGDSADVSVNLALFDGQSFLNETWLVLRTPTGWKLASYQGQEGMGPLRRVGD